MYIQEKNQKTLTEIKRDLLAQLDDQKIKKFADHELDTLVESLFGLNEALVNGWSVWQEIEKEPRNLDSGRHYWSLNYIANNQKQTFWPGCSTLAKYVGMVENNRDRSMPKWTFASSAIGMSRLMDALDGLFYRMKQLGLTKWQMS